MFAHLHVHSPYSFLDGASDLEPLVRRAAELGMPALALTDHDNLCAAVKFTALCRAYGVRPILGAEVTLDDDQASHLTLLARDRDGYANLCCLLTLGHAHGGRLNPRLPWTALPEHARGLVCLSGCRKGMVSRLLLEHQRPAAQDVALQLRDWFGADGFFIELQEDLTPHADILSRELAALGREIGARVVATNNVHYADRRDYPVHDVLRCIATGTAKDEIHPGRPLNAERYLKSAAEMLERFVWCPEALANTLHVADLCDDVLPREVDITPRYPVPAGREGVSDAASYLRYLTWKGAKARYRGLRPEVEARLEHELRVICELGYADYFLMVWEIVRWARKQGIRCTGRGSAADSCVAYALTLTDVDVIARRLPFARFLAPGKMPDIDMDFPSDRRDDVFKYIIGKYGEAHVGMVCTFHTFLARSAVRDVGKALGIPQEALQPLSGRLAGFVRANRLEEAFDQYAELRPHKHLKERFRLLFDLCKRIAGFPRHIGTHSSGVVISREPLARIAPLQPSARGITQIWTLDKDDAEEIGAIKFDVLSLRMLSAVSDAEEDIRAREPAFQYDRLPLHDAQTYRMMRSGAAVGTFQFESAAQLALAVTLQPEHFEDLVASVALIRPGPIRGNIVSRFVACRNGWMRADVLHPLLAPILSKTYGCIVFQEQVNDVVAAMTGCSDAEADKFRKRLTKHTKLGTLHEAREEFIGQAAARHADLSPEAAQRLWEQIEGWGGYGFTEGHAASFALTGYKTAYLSVHHATEFYAGLMNHQPMGYYSANSLAGEARRRGVRILPLDINRSFDKCYAEEPDAIRLGLRLVEGLTEEDIAAIVEGRNDFRFSIFDFRLNGLKSKIENRKSKIRPSFRSLVDFCARVPMHRDRLENLILCGAFDSLGGAHEHRRGLLWSLDETLALAYACRACEVGGTGPDGQRKLELGSAATMETPVAWDVEDFGPWDKFLWTWRLTGVCADSHPLSWMREELARWNILTVYEALRQKSGTRVTVAGLNVRPHRPPTRSGRPVLFTSIEDETGFLQAICAGEAIESCTSVFLSSPAVIVRGILTRKGVGASLTIEKAKPLRSQARGDHRSNTLWSRGAPADYAAAPSALPEREQEEERVVCLV